MDQSVMLFKVQTGHLSLQDLPPYIYRQISMGAPQSFDGLWLQF